MHALRRKVTQSETGVGRSCIWLLIMIDQCVSILVGKKLSFSIDKGAIEVFIRRSASSIYDLMCIFTHNLIDLIIFLLEIANASFVPCNCFASQVCIGKCVIAFERVKSKKQMINIRSLLFIRLQQVFSFLYRKVVSLYIL